MGIWNRDYMRHSGPVTWSPVTWGPIWVIIAINVVVFLGWNMTGRGDPEFFKQHFRTSLELVRAGSVWTLLTAAFSHRDVLHLFMNMLVLHGFGTVLLHAMGPRRFWAFYLAAAVVASGVHVLISIWLTSRDPSDPHVMLGASGAISALVALVAMRNPAARMMLFFVIPMPALALVGLLAAIDLYGLLLQSSGGGWQIGHGAHLGGCAFGLCFHWVSTRAPSFRWRRRVARRRSRAARDGEAAADVQQELDRILAKISKDGMQNLGMSERDFLEKVSRDLRRKHGD